MNIFYESAIEEMPPLREYDPTSYANLAGTLRGSLLSLKYNRDISSLLDNDAAKLKEFQAIIDSAIERAEKQNVKEAVV